MKEEKEGYGEKDLQKRKVLGLECKSEGVMEVVGQTKLTALASSAVPWEK